jgi:DNA-binding transcriptional ArsR family regulator
MRIKREDSMVWFVMHRAAEPAGFSRRDMPERFMKQSQNLSNSMKKLVEKKLATITREGQYVRYRATAEQLASYVSRGYAVQGIKLRSTLRVGQQRMVADWEPDTPPHYPTDEKGRPLYKITVAPKQPQPIKTNTHSGAY